MPILVDYQLQSEVILLESHHSHHAGLANDRFMLPDLLFCPSTFRILPPREPCCGGSGADDGVGKKREQVRTPVCTYIMLLEDPSLASLFRTTETDIPTPAPFEKEAGIPIDLVSQDYWQDGVA